MDCYIITLLKDQERLPATLAALEPYKLWLYPSIVYGVDGRELTSAEFTERRADPHYPGRLGCTLSHVSVWREIVARRGAENNYSLVLEDDANPHDLELVAERQPGLDLLFCNDRAQSRIKTILYGLGTDGYLLTPRGAARLLDLFLCDGYDGHLDQRLASYMKHGKIKAQKMGHSITKHLNVAGPRQRRDSEALSAA